MRRQCVQHGWIGRPIIQMLAAHLKLLKAADHGSHARSVRHRGHRAFPGFVIFCIICRSEEFANGAVALYERSRSGMTRQDHLGVLTDATAESDDLRILARQRHVSVAVPGDPP